MKTLSFDEYDAMIERLHKNKFQCIDWWPSPELLKERIGDSYAQNIDFLTWIIETNLPPETEEEKRSYKYINQVLIENLKLVDISERKKKYLKKEK